ncbi:MAG: polysaccharide deacetylase family protein [Gammaproteobacteria bacterium]|nr:polysaccharide deacetylase family protein [Gammaproteobacteria bacterium]
MRISSPAPEGTAWQPSGFIKGSVALHAAAALLTVVRPTLWPWTIGAVALDHLLLGGAGLWPRSRLLGPNWTHLPAQRLPSVALTIDDGPDPEVTPQVLRLLEAQDARATFFCIGSRVAAHPALAREIIARGHTIENHSYRHSMTFSLAGPRQIAADVRRAQAVIAEATGSAPRFFRAPAGLRNPFLAPVLAQTGLTLVSWTRRGFDTVNTDPQHVLKRLTHGLSAGDILLLHDGHAARTAQGEPLILAVLPALLARLAAAKLRPVTLRSAFAPQAAAA